MQPVVKPAAPVAQLGDDITLRMMDLGRASFLRCFKLAVNDDPTVTAYKVTLHIELDAAGNITNTTHDSSNDALGACLVRSVQRLPFPSMTRATTVDVPLIWRQ
jgi:hypothetical protein